MSDAPEAPPQAGTSVNRRSALAALAVGGTFARHHDQAVAATASGTDLLGSLQRGEATCIVPEQLGANSSADSTNALRTAMLLAAQTGRPIELNGAVRIDKPIIVPGGFSMHGSGIIDLSGGGSITIGNGVSALPDLAANIDLFGTILSFRTAHNLTAGDIVVVWNPTDFSFAPFRPHYREGDMFRVAEVLSPTHVRVFGVAQDPYAADAVKLFKLNGAYLRIEGVGLTPPPDGISLFLDGLADVLLHKIRIESGRAHTGIEVHRCFNVGISDAAITVHAGDSYPIMISNSQKVTISQTRGLYSKRHCIALGGREGEACVPTADVIVSGMIGENLPDEGVGSADIHGNCKRITYDDCHLSMASIGGQDVTFRNCRITGRPKGDKTSGHVIVGSEVAGGTYTISNCHLISVGDGITEACFLDLTVFKRKQDLRLVMRANTFEHVGSPPSTGYLIKLYVGEESEAPRKRIDIDIDGLEYIGAGPAQAIVALAGHADVSALSSIQLAGYSGAYSTILACIQKANYNVAFSGMHDELTGLGKVGDASVRLSADRVSPARPPSPKTVLWSVPLTASRKAAFDVTRARAGDTFRLVRAPSASGAFALNIDSVPPRVLKPGQWCEVTFDGDNWAITASGQL